MRRGPCGSLEDINTQDEQYRPQWQEDAQNLAAIGRAVYDVPMPLVEVWLPAELAERAAAAWRRDDDGEPRDETPAERRTRQRAGSLALIGAAVDERGRREGDVVVVQLSADLVAAAIDAADDERGDLDERGA